MPLKSNTLRRYRVSASAAILARMRTLGIDVSHYQGDVRWHDVAGSNVKFAIAKATEGNASVDALFRKNWDAIQAAGLFRGAYHFGRPGGDARTQAVHFHAVVGALGFRDLPPVLDLEVADGHDAERVLSWARAFVDKGEELFGRKLMIYTGSFWRSALRNSNVGFFGERALWLAGYVSEPKLIVPASWKRWTFWQYTDGSGNKPQTVPGVGPCDQSWFEGSEAELDRLCVGESPAPPPLPEPTSDAMWQGTFFVWPRTPAVQGGCVKSWQERMLRLGYELDADGVYGPQSKRSCAAFQRDHGLVADGIVGKTTWDATFAAAIV